MESDTAKKIDKLLSKGLDKTIPDSTRQKWLKFIRHLTLMVASYEELLVHTKDAKKISKEIKLLLADQKNIIDECFDLISGLNKKIRDFSIGQMEVHLRNEGVTITNLKDIKIPETKIPSFPKKFEIEKAPILEKLLKKLVENTKQAETVVKIANKKPEEYIPVRIVESRRTLMGEKLTFLNRLIIDLQGAGGVAAAADSVVKQGARDTTAQNWWVLLRNAAGNAITSTLIAAKRALDVYVINPATEFEEDTEHTSGDKGIMGLAVRKDNVGSLVDADGNYAPLQVNEHGILRTQAQQHHHIAEMNSVDGWTVLGNDTINLATTTNHVFNTLALEFDKVDGAANTIFAGIQKTITAIDLSPYGKGSGFFLMSAYLSSLADVAYIFLRLGTDNGNYNEWRVNIDDIFNVGWNGLRMSIFSPSEIVGNGWNSNAVTWVSVGVAFNDEADELPDIAFDHLAANTGLHTSADITAEVSSAVSSPNIIVRKWGNAVDTNKGNAGNNTLRTVVATDQPAIPVKSNTHNLPAISTAPTQHTITMTNADQEYSQALPANTKKFTFQCRTEFDIRFAFVTGKVATPTDPYMTLKSGMICFEDNLDLTDETLYVACADAGKKIELICWS